MAGAPMTVVETAEFLKHAAQLLPDSDREQLVAFVGANPEAGEIIQGPAVSGSFVGLGKAWESVAARG
jgi:hypothetical protein